MAAWSRPALPPRWAQGDAPRLVGRSRELAVFEKAWAAAAEGSRQAVFLGGEPGAGKSRLLGEVAVRLHAEGAAVLLGTCVREYGPPYQPFVEPVGLLHGALASGGLQVPDAPDQRELLLRRLATVAGLRQPTEPEAVASTEYRRVLYDAVLQALTYAAADRPVVLLLDDLHWAGVSAMNLLSYVVEHSSDLRLLVVGAQRTTAPDRSPQLVRAVAQLYRLDGVRRLDLPGLDTEDITDYLLGTGGDLTAGRARVAAAILRDQTGGNPFFLRELWRDLDARGGVAALRSASFSPPESVRDTLAARLDRLEAPHRQVVELAAVIGEEFDLATLLAAGEWTSDTTLAAVDEAVAFGLVEETSDGSGGYRFLHALAQQAVLELMPSSRRVATHARIAQTLERSSGDLPVRRLAHHYANARVLGHGDKALHYLLEAARLAAASLAHEQAGRWFEQAAALAVDAAQREAHLFAAAWSHLLGGDFARARTLFEQVSSTADPQRKVEAAIGYESASWRPGRPGHRAVELLTDALATIGRDEADPLYVRALASLGRALAFTGAVDQAGTVGGRAVDLARRAGDDRLLADTLQASLWLGVRPADAPARLARADELARLALRTGDLGHLGPAAHYRGVLSYLQGDPAGWAGAHRDLLRVARSTGQEFFAYMAGCLDFARHLASGHLDAAESTCAALLDVGSSFGTDDTEGSYGLQMFMVRRERGDLQQVRHLVTGDERPDEHWTPGLLAMYTELDLKKPALRLLRRILDEDTGRYEASAEWPAVLTFLVEAAVAVQDIESVSRLRPMLAEYAGLNLVAGQFVAIFGSADRYLGMADSLLGRGDAGEWFESAAEMDTRMGATAHLAQTLAATATHLRRVQAPPEQVREVAGQARVLVDGLGLRRVGRVLDGLALDARPVAGPDGLTARESEVLRLVAVGLSNREIARRLVISQNTAANHVRSILVKTGCGNRTQAAHYAVSRGLMP